MAFGIIKLSEECRDRLSLLFTVLSLLLFIISALLVINSVYVIFAVAPNLHSETAVIRLIFTVIGMLTTQLAVYYITGIFVCRKCHLEAYKKNARYLLRIWMISGYSSIFNVVVIGTMAAGVSNHLVRSMHHSMVRGMKRYLKDVSWKAIIDSLQYRLQCCGSHSYRDWHEISWMSASHIISSANSNGTTSDKFYRISGDRLYAEAVPWSCCRLDYPKQCFHDPIQQSQYTKDWDLLMSASVYNTGCNEVLRQPVENSFLVFILASYVLLLLQIILSIVSRYLYTSFKNAAILGDPFGVAPGWILGKGDFGIVRGPTLSEIMTGSRATATPVSTSIDEEYRTSNDSTTTSTRRSKTRTSDGSDEEYRMSVEDEEALLMQHHYHGI